jgi:hypothetical protein
MATDLTDSSVTRQNNLFEVTKRTIRECIAKNKKELSKNGYEVLKGKYLIDSKLVSLKVSGGEIDFTTIINRSFGMSDL